jgi:ATP/maltotriose-dependent transcriptional regulator MalT
VLDDLAPLPGCRCIAVLCLWYLGYPDRSRARLADVLARGAASPQSPLNVRVLTLQVAAIISRYARDARRALEYADAVVAVCDEHGLLQWRALGMLARGWALGEQGEVEEGLAEVRRASATYGETGSTSSLPWFLLELAEVLGRADRPTEGLAILEGLRVAQDRGVRHRQSEGERIRGELLLREGRTPEKAEACFRNSLALAREQQARCFELRAALALARLLQSQGRRAEARRMLAEIYNWFTEGHDTADLIEARAMLADLGQA